MSKELALRKWRGSKAYSALMNPQGLNASEQVVFSELRAEGFLVYRNGWPDFLAERDGQVLAIEVKSGNDRLSLAQKRIHRMLRRHGIEVEIRRISGASSVDDAQGNR